MLKSGEVNGSGLEPGEVHSVEEIRLMEAVLRETGSREFASCGSVKKKVSKRDAAMRLPFTAL